MIRSLMKLCVFVAICSTAMGQTQVTKTKPVLSGWAPTDFASVEVRVKGRLSTDPATTHKIIGRIMLKGLDISMLTQRVTILVPANQTWEIKSISANFTPVNTTGVGPFEIPLLAFATSYFPTPGQVLAIDVDSKNGPVFMGPVVPLPPVVAPPSPTPVPSTSPSAAGSCITPTGLSTTDGAGCASPKPSLVDSTGGTWVFTLKQVVDQISKQPRTGEALRDGVDTAAQVNNFGYWPLSYIYIRPTGVLCGFNPNHGDICWTAGKWQ